MHNFTVRQRQVLAGCVTTASKESRRFPLTAAQLSELVSVVNDGTANDEQFEAAAVIAAFAPFAQPETSSADWRVLTRALVRFDFDRFEPHPHWRDLALHHLALGGYAK